MSGKMEQDEYSAPEPPVDFVIITALPQERDAFLSKLPGAHVLDKGERDLHTYYAARVRTRRQDQSEYNVVVTYLARMGPITATAQTVSVVTRWRPRYVLLVGIACGIRGVVEHGDVLIASQVADYTIGKQEGGPRKINWDVYPCGVSLLDSANSVEDGWKTGIGVDRPGKGEPAREKGVVASGGDVIQDDEIIATYSKSWPKLIGIEMESGGVAAGVHQTPDRPEFLMIKSVSDFGKDKHDPEVTPWREYACHTAAAFAVDIIKSGPSPSRAITKGGDAEQQADEKRRDGERQWEYVLSHPFKTLDWFLLLKADVGRSLFDRIIHETTLTFDRSTTIRLGSLVSKPTPHEPDNERHRDYGFRFWQTYRPEAGYWVSRRGAAELGENDLVSGVSGTVPWSALSIQGLESLRDLSKFTEVGISLPPYAYQAGVVEYELTFSGDTFSFDIQLSEEGVLPMLHEMAWTQQLLKEQKGRGNDDVFAQLGTSFAGGQLLDKFFKQWMRRWQVEPESSLPFKGRLGRSGQSGQSIHFFPNEPKSFRGSEEEKDYIFTIPGDTEAEFKSRVAELEEETRSSEADEASFVELASLYGAQGRLPEGIELLQRAANAGRGGRDIHRVWGQILSRMARHAEAVEHLERAVSIDGRCAESRIRLALALSDAGRELEAIPEFRTAFELEPRNPQYQRNLAYSLARAGVESEEAVALLEQYVAATPDDSAAMTALATLLERVGRRDDAYVMFERSTKASGADANTFVHHGLSEARAGKQQGAVAAFQRALELKKDPETFVLLGGSFVGLNRFEEAEKAFREGHRMDPDHQESLAQLGATLGKRGAVDEALPLLEKAVALDPKDKQSQGNLKILKSKRKGGWLKRLGILR
jgi:tetratricopeptide (TPR) repeat protein/nucleoside phosphorylase